jgi:putative transposase
MLGRATARRADAGKDFIEQATTDLARRFDVMKIESPKVRNMTKTAKGTIEQPGTNVKAKASLNAAILDKAWGRFATGLEHKAKGRVVLVRAAYTSQTCSVCKTVDPNNRKNQAEFECTTCGYRAGADFNAAQNIAAGHAATALGDLGLPGLRNANLNAHA